MKTIILILAVLLPLANAGAQANASQPLTGEAVLARYVAALGGEAAIRAVKSRYMVITMSMGLGGQSRVESFVNAPNKLYRKSTMSGIGVVETGYDGTTAWTMSQATGPVIVPEPQATQLRRGTNLIEILQEGASLTLRGQQQLDGRTVHVVDAVAQDGTSMTEYFDVESGLLVGMDVPGTVVRDGRASLAFGDYRRFGSVLVATLLTHRLASGDSLVTRVEHVDHRPIPDSVFALPKAVQALANRSPR